MSKIKGNAFITAYEYFLNMGGKAGMEKIKASLIAKDREELFSKPVLIISWIDYTSYLNFIFAATKILEESTSQPRAKWLEGMAIYQAQKDFQGIFKIFARVLTTEYILKRTAHLWRTYYDAGEATVKSISKNHIQIQVVNFPDIPANHELEQLAYFEEVIRICGEKYAKVTHPQCIARGDAYCLFDVFMGDSNQVKPIN